MPDYNAKPGYFYNALQSPTAGRRTVNRRETPRKNTVTLTPQRAHVTPEPDETFAQLIERVMPDEDADAALEKLKSWNLHIFLRRPSGLLLGSDIVFIEPPR
jgi:hypothetical protein